MTITRSLFLMLFALCLNYKANGQVKFYGEVTSSAGEDLAFVSILIDADSSHVAFSDIEGRFSVNLKQVPHAVMFRYVGYEPLIMDSTWLQTHINRFNHIVIREAKNELEEVDILPGENPADRIIRNVVENRKAHDPEQCPEYICQIYGKQNVQTNANWRGLLNIYSTKKDFSILSFKDSTLYSLEQAHQHHKLYKERKSAQGNEHDNLLVESVIRRSFRFPDQVKQEVLKNRVSGFHNFPLAAIPDLVQPFSFYRDYIPLIDKAFVNPVSPNSPKLYFFNIEDTLYQGVDTVFVISFQPHRGKIFDALKGTLYINSNGWAVQNVRAEPANKNSALWLKIEQQYSMVADSISGEQRWFPEQLNFEMAFGDASGLQFRAAGRSWISSVNFHPHLVATDFDTETPVVFLPHANTRADSSWAQWHASIPLTGREQRTFAFMDSLGQRRHFNRIEWIANTVFSGTTPSSRNIGFDLSKFVGINDFETVRVGVGLTTAQHEPYSLPHRFDAEAWTGYGMRDQLWKYGAALFWRTGPIRSTVFSLEYKHDLFASGAIEGWLDFRGGFDQSVYAKTLNKLDEASLSVRGKPFKDFSFYLALRWQTFQPTFNYAFEENALHIARQPFVFTENIASVRYAWGEVANEVLHADWQLQQPIPVVEATWMHGWNGVLGGQYQYDRYILALYQTRFIRRLGKMTWRVETGIIRGNLPFPKLYIISQPGGGLSSAFAVANSIQTLDTLVVSDHFVNFFFTQQIGNVLYRSHWSSPYLSLIQNGAWGGLRHPEFQKISFRILNIPVLESGFRLDDIVRLNILHFGYLGGGVAAFYSWGPRSYSNWRKNIAIRASVRWSF